MRCLFLCRRRSRSSSPLSAAPCRRAASGDDTPTRRRLASHPFVSTTLFFLLLRISPFGRIRYLSFSTFVCHNVRCALPLLVHPPTPRSTDPPQAPHAVCAAHTPLRCPFVHAACQGHTPSLLRTAKLLAIVSHEQEACVATPPPLPVSPCVALEYAVVDALCVFDRAAVAVGEAIDASYRVRQLSRRRCRGHNPASSTPRAARTSVHPRSLSPMRRLCCSCQSNTGVSSLPVQVLSGSERDSLPRPPLPCTSEPNNIKNIRLTALIYSLNHASDGALGARCRARAFAPRDGRPRHHPRQCPGHDGKHRVRLRRPPGAYARWLPGWRRVDLVRSSQCDVGPRAPVLRLPVRHCSVRISLRRESRAAEALPSF
eukprot:Rhum_TRINITY_DN13802_c0_g2::Rhum_TRINITY_DN13802_c0_g2_i1::g.64483::m.64483